MNAVFKILALTGVLVGAGAACDVNAQLAKPDFKFNISQPSNGVVTIDYSVRNSEESVEEITGISIYKDLKQVGAYDFTLGGESFPTPENANIIHLLEGVNGTFADATLIWDCNEFSADSEGWLNISYKMPADRITGWDVRRFLISSKNKAVNGGYVLTPAVNTTTNYVPYAWQDEYFDTTVSTTASWVVGFTSYDRNKLDAEDRDGDGFDNLFEYITDTDPTDSGSYMQLILAPADKGSIIVSVVPLSERAIYDLYGAKNNKKPLEYMGSFTSEDGGLLLRGNDKKKRFELDVRMQR